MINELIWTESFTLVVCPQKHIFVVFNSIFDLIMIGHKLIIIIGMFENVELPPRIKLFWQ